MSIIDTLITDRTQVDVDRAQELYDKGINGMTTAELAEFMAGMRGAHNPADLNRINEAMEYIADRLRKYGHTVTLQPGRTWTLGDMENPALTNVLLANLAVLRGVLTMDATTPAVPDDLDKPTFQKANDIEQILVDIERLINLMIQSFLRCGNATTYSGARGLPTENYIMIREITWAELDQKGWTWEDWAQKTWFQILLGR